MPELRKDNPAYYRVKIEKLIKQAKENNLEVGFEISSRESKITQIDVIFMDKSAECAYAKVYENR